MGAEGQAGAAARASWQVVHEHYDERIGEGGAGLDLVTSAQPRPRALVRRPRGSEDDYLFPRWSPAGTHIAYFARVGAREGVHVMRANGTGAGRIAAGGIIDFSWSPDGATLAFVSGCEPYSPSDGLQGCANARIELVPRTGGRRRTVVRPRARPQGHVSLQGWSPDGRRLLYLVDDRAGDRLSSVDLRSGVQRSLARGRLGAGSWSPDGRLIAFTERCTENRIGDVFCDVAVMRADGSAKRVLRRGDAGRASGPTWAAPVWIPRTNAVVFDDWGRKPRLLRLDVGTGAIETLAREPFGTLRTSADGRMLGGMTWDGFVIAGADGSVVARGKPRSGCAGACDLWLR